MSTSRTKFYLDKMNAKWKGVCAGIADYTGIDVVWVRISAVLLTLMGGFPWTIIAYFMAAWLADKKPIDLYRDDREQKFWQGVRQSPKRTARDVRARFREIDRRLADMEIYYTTTNSRLSDEIERLR
ncbi:envelope stress response membrane protein PspC [Sphingorhabdus sp. Alg239-R122]|uniref:envelope stress response membrane protein PspC n=1 Tax=Sphingorhabdus sp. Alg239-R122 TaxID=2305989 RepID=UPI0013DCE520|nr:envelope stress response membrane protein PspC [Sphingorhabdus sp. Alg239-R122]